MADETPNPEARTVEVVFKDFNRRRTAILKALTSEAKEFFRKCDPDKDELCLYGFPNGKWEVIPPNEDVPPDLPEPTLGINFSRDEMPRKEWLTTVAIHSDAWLLSVSFFIGSCYGFVKKQRMKLFDMINSLPTILEIVTGVVKQPKEKSATQNSSSKSKSTGKTQSSEPNMKGHANISGPHNQYDEIGNENEYGDEEAKCGACGNDNDVDPFWICCDTCEVWFHGKCVSITPVSAAHIKQYKCQHCCSNKRPRV